MKKDIVIVGGGIAGTSAAWLLGSNHNVTVLESRDKCGGHVDPVKVELDGREHTVDLGAQFFSQTTHPIYMRLQEMFDLDSEQISFNAGITLLDNNESDPLFVSPKFLGRLWPLFASFNREGIKGYAQLRKQALRFYSQKNIPNISTGDWIDSLDVSDSYKKNVFMPVFSAVNGSNYDLSKEYAVDQAMAFFGRDFNWNPFRPATNIILRGGLSSVIDALILRSPASFFTNSEVVGIKRSDSKYRVHTKNWSYVADEIIFATPPYATKKILEDYLDHSDSLITTLNDFSYFESRIVLHRDPTYMHSNPKYWSEYNATRGETHCEASVWYSRLLGTKDPLFKSWANARPTEPKQLIAERTFLHPHVDTTFVNAQQKLKDHQGSHNFHFVGSYVMDVDSQNTALLSAMHVAKKLGGSTHKVEILEGKNYIPYHPAIVW